MTANFIRNFLFLVVTTGTLLLSGCAVEAGGVSSTVSHAGTVQPSKAATAPRADSAPAPLQKRDAVVLAINVGGGAHTDNLGVDFIADAHTRGGVPGSVPEVRGTQNQQVYRSYRAGDIALSIPVPDGRYDVTLMMIEPEDQVVGSRVFDVLMEGQLRIDDLDIRLARDNNHISSLRRAVADVDVSDGRLDIDFAASKGTPLLCGVVIRSKATDTRAWRLLWADEFDYQGPPDPDNWSIQVWPSRTVNSEDQAYTDRPKNVRVADGHLILEAHLEDYAGAHYTSGRIHSQGKRDLLYGRIDVRARLPGGQGTWAAIWMLPSDPYRYSTSCEPGEFWQGSRTCDAWPNSGEIDIMENVGFERHVIHGTVHNRGYYFINQQQRKASIEAPGFDREFHVYSIEWTPQEIHIDYDDTVYFSYLNDGTGWESWPYDHPYNLILNLAIGGDWGRAGGPIDDSMFPTRMEVDYVRVFEPAETEATGE